MNEREMLLKQIATMDFSIIELGLYMDTHPYDTEMNDKLNNFKNKVDILKKEYNEKYGPITQNSDEKNRWGWIANPWPWDNMGE